MSITASLRFQQKKSALKNNLVSQVSNCLKIATEKERLSFIQSELTSSIKSVLKKTENFKSASGTVDLNLTLDTINHSFILISNPKIEKLRKDKRAIEQELWLKENELRDLNQRHAITKDLTRNEAIKGLVFNIIEKFKTLSKEKQIEFAMDKKKLSRIVENYVESLINFHEEKKSWGVDFTDKENLLDDLSTGKDVVVLAANLSSKYVHMATRTAHGATSLQLEICIGERDQLKLKLAEIDRQLELEYVKDGEQNGFRGGFSGGDGGGGGASVPW